MTPGADRSRCGLVVLLGHLWRCKRSVDGSDVPHPVSELTTRPRLGEDCWSRGLRSACFWLVAGWRVVHSGASLGDAFRIAPSAAPGNRRLHGLPWRPSGSKLGFGLCLRLGLGLRGQTQLQHEWRSMSFLTFRLGRCPRCRSSAAGRQAVTALHLIGAIRATAKLAVAAVEDRRASTPPSSADAMPQLLARGCAAHAAVAMAPAERATAARW